MWIRFGCFLTGYNYRIVRASSEVAAKAVKRYTAALLIVCILWSFVGYMFTSRYLHGGVWESIAGAAVMVTIIIQIERQIILSVTPSRGLYIARGLIAAMMAIIGAIIIDQVLFKEDIEIAKTDFVNERTKRDFASRSPELRAQIVELDTNISRKETERTILIDEITAKPTIKSVSSSTLPVTIKTTTRDSTGIETSREQIRNTTTVQVTDVPNPKQALLAPLDSSINDLRAEKVKKEQTLLTLREAIHKENASKIGFLDELIVMFKLVTGSGVAAVVWFLWFFFLFGLEMLVLISKISEKKNDYEETVLHQMKLQLQKLKVLERLADKPSVTERSAERIFKKEMDKGSF